MARLKVSVDSRYADMEPHIASEQGGKRPVVVLQNNIGNRHSPTLIVATVTTRTEKKKNQPTHVLVDSKPAFEEPSMILLEQIFTIDKSRMQVMRSCGPHPNFSHSAFNAAAVSASMPSFRRRAGYQRVELSLCALARGVVLAVCTRTAEAVDAVGTACGGCSTERACGRGAEM